MKLVLLRRRRGGGSIVALKCSIRCSTYRNGSRFDHWQGKDAAGEAEMKTVLDRFHELESSLLSLIDKDSNAFNKIMAAFKIAEGH